MSRIERTCFLVLCISFMPSSGGAQCLPKQELFAPAAQAGDGFGEALALAADGARVFIGAPFDDDAAADAGSVQIFARTPSGYVFESQLLALDAQAGHRFGTAIDVTPDGSRMIVGAPGHNGGGHESGSVYLWSSNGAGWDLEAQFFGAELENLGVAGVALSADGSQAFGAAPGNYPLPHYKCTGPGSVYEFTRSNSVWSFVQQVSLGFALLGNYGSALDVSGDGTRLFIGDSYWDCGGPTPGAIFFLERSGSDWALEDSFISDPYGSELYHRIGESLAVGSTGERLVSGAPVTWTTGNNFPGAVVLFEHQGAPNEWVDIQTIFASDGEDEDEFGARVAWSDDESLLIVGAPGDDDAGQDAGAIYLFEEQNGILTEAQKITAPATAGDSFGRWVALTSAGEILASSPGDDIGALDAGSVAVFDPAVFDPTPPIALCTAKVTSGGCVPSIDWTGAPSTSGGAFPISCREIPNGVNGLFFYGLSGPAAIPFLGGTLCALPPLQRTVVQNAGGNPPPASDCSGGFVFFANAWFAAGADTQLVPGSQVNGQFWFRDSNHPDGTGAGLSNAIEFYFCE